MSTKTEINECYNRAVHMPLRHNRHDDRLFRGIGQRDSKKARKHGGDQTIIPRRLVPWHMGGQRALGRAQQALKNQERAASLRLVRRTQLVVVAHSVIDQKLMSSRLTVHRLAVKLAKVSLLHHPLQVQAAAARGSRMGKKVGHRSRCGKEGRPTLSPACIRHLPAWWGA